MKKFKRRIAAIAASALAVTVAVGISACSKSSDDTILFMAYSPANNTVKSIYTQILKDFTAETGINVKPMWVPKDNYNTKLKSNFGTKNSNPDVFYLDQPVLADYVEQCMSLDDGFFAADGGQGLRKSDFFDAAMDTTVYKGTCYAVPLSITTSILLYNKSLVSGVPADWDGWLGTTVTGGKALFNGIGSGGYASWYFQAFLKSAGGEMVKDNAPAFNGAEGKAAAQMIADLYAKSPQAVRTSSNSFTQGNVYYKLAHSADIVNCYASAPDWCAANLGATTFIPRTAGGVSYSNIGGENLAIRKNSGKEEACEKLVRYLLKEENLKRVISDNFPALKSAAAVNSVNPVTGEQIHPVVQRALEVVLEQLGTASARPAVKNWMQVNDQYLGNALSEILDNGKDIQKSLDTAAEQARAILKF